MNSSKDFETVSKKFDMEYAKLTILLDSLDVNEVEESLHYGEGEGSLCDWIPCDKSYVIKSMW